MIPAHEVLPLIFNCGVFMFLMISGYLFGTKQVTAFKSWFIKRITTVMIPAVLLSVIFIVVLFFYGEKTTIPTIVAYCADLEGLLFLNWNLANKLFHEISGLGHLWFTTIIMLCYCMVPLFQKYCKPVQEKKQFRKASALLVVAAIVIFFVSKYIMLWYFFSFFIGYFAGKNNWLKKVNGKAIAIATGVSAIIVIGRVFSKMYWEASSYYQVYSVLFQMTIGMYSVLLISFLSNKFPKISETIGENKVINFLDKYSYYVYLCHGVLCLGTFNVYEKFSMLQATGVFLIGTILLTAALGFVCETLKKPIMARITK